MVSNTWYIYRITNKFVQLLIKNMLQWSEVHIASRMCLEHVLKK
jgi:hypothetical protein